MKFLRIIDLNELDITELVLSINVRIISRKVAFNMVKACKSREYVDGNAAIATE